MQKVGSKKKTRVQLPARAANNAKSGGSLGRLINGGVSLAKKLPVIGDVVDKVETVASTICNFLGLGSSLLGVHYGADGGRYYKLHSRLENHSGMYEATGDIEGGDILMKIMLSPGPEGSRSRIMGQLYEKVQYNNAQLEVLPCCAATEPGSLAYVFVPDPSDTVLDEMSNSARLASVLARENVRVCQIWQSSVLSFPLPQRDFYVNVANDEKRFTSPGCVYVVSMTTLDSTKLPTIRQTLRLTFSRATLVPRSVTRESALYTMIGFDTATDPVVVSVKSFGSWDVSRTLDVIVKDSFGNNVNMKGVLVRKGETLTIFAPNMPDDVAITTTDSSVALAGYSWLHTSEKFGLCPLIDIRNGYADLTRTMEVPMINDNSFNDYVAQYTAPDADLVFFPYHFAANGYDVTKSLWLEISRAVVTGAGMLSERDLSHLEYKGRLVRYATRDAIKITRKPEKKQALEESRNGASAAVSTSGVTTAVVTEAASEPMVDRRAPPSIKVTPKGARMP